MATTEDATSVGSDHERDSVARESAARDQGSKMHEEQDLPQELGFFCSYPVENTRLAMLQALRNEWGLVPRLPRSNDCIFQWSPYSRINWKQAFDGTLIVSSYFAHAGLSEKSRLMLILEKFSASIPSAAGNNESSSASSGGCIFAGTDLEDRRVAREILGGFRVLTDKQVRAADDLQAILAADPDCVWVLKASRTNNATQVHFLQGDEFDARSWRHTDDVDDDENDAQVASDWLLQALVERPLLYHGRKFHMRVNVLAVGRLRVLVHRDVVLHVACEPYKHADWDEAFVHITNHVVQSRHPAYDPAAAQISLATLERYLDSARGGTTHAERRIRAAIHGAVRAVFAAVRREGAKQDFFPMLNAFEVFGFDFIVRDDAELSLQLLEVNHGPALEGHTTMKAAESAFQDSVCYRTVRDVLRVVLGGAIEAKAATSLETGFDQVFATPSPEFLSPRMVARLAASRRSSMSSSNAQSFASSPPPPSSSQHSRSSPEQE